MKNLKLISALILCLLTGSFIQAQDGVPEIKSQITSMLFDSQTDFIFNQGPVTPAPMPAFEDGINKTKYYKSNTQYKGEVSLVREQERNDVVYKTLIFGWKLNYNTPKNIRQEAENVRKATMEIIAEKVATGAYKSFKVKATDSTMRTELRDSVGNRIIEIAENKSFLHLIVFGKKWRTDTVDGLDSDFSINSVVELKDKRRTLKLDYPYELVGVKNDVALYAATFLNDVIFAVDNPTAKVVSVKITVSFQCAEKGSTTYKKKDANWIINVQPNSLKSYDKEKAACIVSGCDKQTKTWTISSWSVE